MSSGSRTVHLELEDGTQYTETGRLKFQEVAVDQATGSVTLRAQFPNPRGVLLPGMYVHAVVDEAVNSTALLAPQRSISRDSNGNAVALIVGKEDQVEERAVVTARAVGNDWLVLSGLKPGDRLIVEGLNKVHPGDKVRAVAADAGVAKSDVAHGNSAPGVGASQSVVSNSARAGRF
jgi:membrane fusion protein (multidrug efflux system)